MQINEYCDYQQLNKNALALNQLINDLGAKLKDAEQYGDEFRNTLRKHNLTHLANLNRPGMIEKRMQMMQQTNYGMTLSLLLATTLLISGCTGIWSKPEKEIVVETKLLKSHSYKTTP